MSAQIIDFHVAPNGVHELSQSLRSAHFAWFNNWSIDLGIYPPKNQRSIRQSPRELVNPRTVFGCFINNLPKKARIL